MTPATLAVAVALPLLGWTLAASPAPPAGEVTPAQAAQALKGIENPVTEARVRALGPGWEKAMEALLRDPATSPVLRPRAVAALGFSKLPSSAAALREVLAARGGATEGVGVIETREAVRALAAVDGARALPELRRFLTHGAWDVRAAAATGLGAVGTREARQALQAQLAREPEPLARREMEAALAAAEARARQPTR